MLYLLYVKRGRVSKRGRYTYSSPRMHRVFTCAGRCFCKTNNPYLVNPHSSIVLDLEENEARPSH